MDFIKNFWWLLVLPAALVLWAWGIRRTPTRQWLWILRIVGVVLISTGALWFVTGDVNNQYISIQLTSWTNAVGAITIGIVALLGAQWWSLRRGPPA